MKIKNFFFLFMLAALYGCCNMAYRMTANGELAYRSHSECGDIVITGISQGTDCIYMCFNGDFMLYPDSLRILRKPYDENQVTRIYLGDSLINHKDSIFIEGEGKLEITIGGGALPPIHYGDRSKDCIGRTIKISPSNFIMCNGKPILTDSVLFWVKGMKSIMVFAWSKKVPDGI